MTLDALNAPPKIWAELEADERLLVMTWMRESIHSGMKKQIMHHTYHAFIRVLHKDGNFDPAFIWSGLPEPTRAHFGHAADILAQLDSDIEFLEDELEQDVEGTVENDPFSVGNDDDQVDKDDQRGVDDDDQVDEDDQRGVDDDDQEGEEGPQ